MEFYIECFWSICHSGCNYYTMLCNTVFTSNTQIWYTCTAAVLLCILQMPRSSLYLYCCCTTVYTPHTQIFAILAMFQAPSWSARASWASWPDCSVAGRSSWPPSLGDTAWRLSTYVSINTRLSQFICSYNVTLNSGILF